MVMDCIPDLKRVRPLDVSRPSSVFCYFCSDIVVLSLKFIMLLVASFAIAESYVRAAK